MKKTIKDIEVGGKRVLLRVDFNVPIENHKVADDTRLQASLPTIRYLIERGAMVMMLSHLGHQSGYVVEDLRMDPVAERLSELLQMPVAKINNCVGPEVADAVKSMLPGQVIFLENVRFHPGEMINEPHFARRLAENADIYVDDAFATIHRIHASIVGIAQYLPSVAGLLVEKEMSNLRLVQKAIQPPVVAVLGGDRLTDKTHFLDDYLGQGNHILLGGVLANTFLKAKGLEVGKSMVETEILGLARQILIDSHGLIDLPKDVVITDSLKEHTKHQVVACNHVPSTAHIVDIGPATIQHYNQILGSARTLIWNGTMGQVEVPPFKTGTDAIARKIASLSESNTIVGGGNTLSAVKRLGLEGHINHLSTGGASMLLVLANKPLPGLLALLNKDESQPIGVNPKPAQDS